MKFSRGFKETRDKVKKGLKYTRSCFNCDYYYKKMGDKEEVCQNPNVTKFDMVVSEGNIYCCFWCMSGGNKDDSPFKGGGRKRVI